MRCPRKNGVNIDHSLYPFSRAIVPLRLLREGPHIGMQEKPTYPSNARRAPYTFAQSQSSTLIERKSRMLQIQGVEDGLRLSSAEVKL